MRIAACLGFGYVVGLIVIMTSGSDMARDPRRFWPALLLWPAVALVGAIDSLLNRM